MKEAASYKRYAKVLLKIGITGLALWFVLKNVDLAEVMNLWAQIQPGWLVLAVLAFALSKTIAALRLNAYFHAQSVELSTRANLYLYALGMFYNLFLPGGIGGDGYKVYWLHQHLKAKVKSSILSLLLDRVNGLAALVWLALGGVLLFSLPARYKWLALLAFIVLYPLYYAVTAWFFRRYRSIWLRTAMASLLVQISQLACVLCIMLALGITEHWLAYSLIFLISSIVAVIPLTIGGLGSRELVFLLSAEWLGLMPDISISISLIFYFITALVSFMGGYFVLLPHKILLAHEKDAYHRGLRIHR